MDPCTRNLEGNQTKTSIQINELESDESGSNRNQTNGDKPGNHDEIGSSRRETLGDKPENYDETRSSKREKNTEIMTKQDPVEGRQSKGEETNPEIMTKQDPVEGRQKGRQTWKSRQNKIQ